MTPSAEGSAPIHCCGLRKSGTGSGFTQPPSLAHLGGRKVLHHRDIPQIAGGGRAKKHSEDSRSIYDNVKASGLATVMRVAWAKIAGSF